MGNGEFAAWQAFYQTEPFGELRSDIRMAMLAALLANINRDETKQSEPFAVQDFLPDYWAEHNESEDKSSLLEQKMRLIATTINAQNGLNHRDVSS